MCRSAGCPWCHPNDSGTTQQPQREAGSDTLPPPPPPQRTPAAVSALAPENQIGRNTCSNATGNRAAPHGGEASPNRTQSNAQGNHEVEAPQQPPNAADAERATSNQAPPSLHEVPANSTRAGAAPHAPGGVRHGGGNRARPSANGHGIVLQGRACLRGLGVWGAGGGWPPARCKPCPEVKSGGRGGAGCIGLRYGILGGGGWGGRGGHGWHRLHASLLCSNASLCRAPFMLHRDAVTPPGVSVTGGGAEWQPGLLRLTPCVTFRLVVVSSWGPGQSPVLPSGRCFLSAAAAGALAGVVSAFAEPSSWCAGAVLNVAVCAVCASAAPSSWRTEGVLVVVGVV